VTVGTEVIDLTSDAGDPASSSALANEGGGGFEVHLEEFAGPFDVLLGLISKHKLEVTELALSQVTDEFCAYIRSQGSEWDLAEATSFLVIAATLLDLKAARLLPTGEVEDEEDLALLEARDLLFARLLQYRAFKEVSVKFQQRIDEHAGRLPRTVGLDPEFANLLPDVVISIGAERFALLAASALAPKVAPTVGIDHIHAPAVSVAARLAREGSATFRALIADVQEIGVIVARFLCLLELYRQGRVALEQAAALGDLHIRWTGDEELNSAEVESEFDEAEALFAAAEDGTAGARQPTEVRLAGAESEK
jgi:segregation and condensation protein A